ncbi:hypothetical protein PilKf_02552 [Pillotina sp. SPG140]|jgi:hypothetical protein
MVTVSCGTLSSVLGGGAADTDPTTTEIISGLKEALKVGSEHAVNGLSQAGGFSSSEQYKILLPPEAQPIMDNITVIPGGQQLVDEVLSRMNASAEYATEKAGPIFVHAITNMSISDALAVLKGSDTAATDYLQRTTGEALKEAFKADIDRALQTPLIAHISTETAWNRVVSAYNTVAQSVVGSLRGMQPLDGQLSDYILDKALSAIFSEVAANEQKIRADPFVYGSALIEKVFSYAKQ